MNPGFPLQKAVPHCACPLDVKTVASKPSLGGEMRRSSRSCGVARGGKASRLAHFAGTPIFTHAISLRVSRSCLRAPAFSSVEASVWIGTRKSEILKMALLVVIEMETTPNNFEDPPECAG